MIALGFGTLGLGIAEFVMMAILPYVARDMGVDIPTAGNFISAYALGVFCGAPGLTFVRRFPLKNILLGLVVIMLVGNLFASLSVNYGMLLVGRFVSGLPHGAYFGVASIVAEKLADHGKGSQAVSIMIAGMTVANLFGVPLGTSISTLMSWRVTFILVSVICIGVFYYIYKWVPQVEGLPKTNYKSQFHFLRRPAPWLIIFSTMLGNGAVFCWYSYVNPYLTARCGFDGEFVPFLMVLAGFGMVVGNLVSGRMSDRFTPGRVAFSMQVLICLALLGLFFSFPLPWVSVLLMCVCTFGLFAVSSPLQVSIIHFSKGGELLGAACIQMAFNLGNAIGAAMGGIPLRQGLGYEYTALIAMPVVLVGAVLTFVFVSRYERFANLPK